MTTPRPEQRLIELVVQTRLGEPDPQDVAELQSLLEEPKMRRLYLELVNVHSHLETTYTQHASDELSEQATLSDVITTLNADEPEPIHIDASTPLTKKAYSSALSYVIEHTFTRKRIAALSAAAVLLLGVVLSIVLLTSGEETAEVATLPDFTHLTPTPDPNRVVATVTDQVNAQWVSANGQGALPDRMLLAVNQRLTLVQGFAEITTNRGAKVLIQAPATIETTDSDNAIRLHRGKLVGRCETPSSKGFTVHAPGMDVVDLGTVFGVEADAEEGSSVLVIEGSVRAQPATTSPLAFEPVVLETNQARRVTPETGQLETLSMTESPIFHPEPVHPYLAAVLESKPVAYWRFEEQASQAIKNEIDPRRTVLQARGSVRLDADGLLGRSARFDNTDESDGYYLTTEPFDAIDTNGPFALEMWVWIGAELDQDTGSGSLGGLYDMQSENLDHVVHMELQPQDAPDEWGPKSFRVHYEDLVIDQEGESQVHGLFSERPYTIDRWQHIVVNHEGGQLELYIDGQSAGTIPAEIDPVNQPALVLGRSMRLERYLRNSKIDEVAFYDRAMTADEIQSHWQAIQPLDQAWPNP